MIIAESKGLEEVLRLIKPYQKILLAGCSGCATVCLAGGAKEVGLTASALRLARSQNNQPLEVLEQTAERQCEYEFNQVFTASVSGVEAVLSLACGVGVQTLAEQFPDKIVLPGLNTRFMGRPVQQGVWEQRCQGCGECLLDRTFGICPLARCAKGMLNGPCGGSRDGKCEIDGTTDCGWLLIYGRAKRLGQLAKLAEPIYAKDWSKTGAGSGKVVRGYMCLDASGK